VKAAILAAFRMIPRRYRFRVALSLAVVFGPLYRFVPRYKRRLSPLDGYREEVLRALVEAMTFSGVRYDPVVHLRGSDVPAGAAIYASVHFLLNGLFLRWLLDHGHRPLTIANQPPGRCYAGTTEVIVNVPPGSFAFAQARRYLREGRKILLNIDDRVAHEGWTKVVSVDGTKYLSDAVMHFAEKSGTPLFFAFVRVEHGRVVATLTAAPAKAETALAAFLERLEAEAAMVKR
jgi:hypothetical protein